MLFRSRMTASALLDHRDLHSFPTRRSSDPDVLAQGILEDLEAALEPFCEIAANLRANSVSEQDP